MFFDRTYCLELYGFTLAIGLHYLLTINTLIPLSSHKQENNHHKHLQGVNK